MGYLQNYSSERTVYLTLEGVESVDVLYTDVVIRYKKAGQATLQTKTLMPNDWINLGGGRYTLKFSSSEMDTLGNFYFEVVSVKQDNLIYDEFQIDPVSSGSGVNPAIEPDICVLSGQVRGIGGGVARQYPVVIKPVEFPARYGQNVISSDQIQTVTDAYGNFSVKLVRNSIVIVIIERAAIRHQITIPDSPTADLMSLLPPFVIDYSNP